jgi:sulfhydrogenase subunit gamma (sulfur reductase)
MEPPVQDDPVRTASRLPGPESLYRPILCRLESVTDLTPVEKNFRLLRLDGRPFGHQPGQFVQVSVFGIGEAPISVASSPTRGPYLDLGVRRAGTLTGALHEMAPGDQVGIRGPLGTCFDVGAMRGKDLLLISGGCGLAPMRALVQYCEDRRDEFGRVTFLYGAKTPDDVLYKGELSRWSRSEALDCRYTVDGVPRGQSWQGEVGLITKLMPPLQLDPGRTIAVVVGPPVMYRFVISELHQKGMQDENIVVSLERHMKCGVGKCGHCTIEHLYCCLDGPVFRLSEVAGLRGAL